MILSNENKHIIKALFAIKQKLRPMKKEADNPFFKSKYLELSEILINLEPLLHEEGTFLTQGTRMKDGVLLVISRLTHVDSGEFAESEFPATVEKADPQKLGSAVSYARRYSVQALFALNVIDDDGNLASDKKVESKPAQSGAKSGFGKSASKEDVVNIPVVLEVSSISTEGNKVVSQPVEVANVSGVGVLGPVPRKGSFGNKSVQQ